MRDVNGTELLTGSDHEFVVNLYTVVLNRWPDEDGYRHYLGRVENRPGERRAVIEEVASSAEAQNLGVALSFADSPAPTTPAAPAPGGGAASADLATALAALQARLPAMPPLEMAGAQRLLAEALAQVAAHQARAVEDRLAALERRLPS